MKKYLYGLMAIVILAFAACTKEDGAEGGDGPGKTPDVTGEYQPGELLVKFKPYVSDILDQMKPATRGSMTRSGILSVDEVMKLVAGYEIERLFPVDNSTEERTREAELHLWYLVRFDEELDPREIAARLSVLGEIQQVSLNRTIHRAYKSKATPLSLNDLAEMEAAARTRGPRAGYVFDDPMLPQQWHIVNRGDMFGEKSIVGADVQAEAAWEKTTGDPSIIVAVLDEGIMIEHPDLKASMWVNEKEVYRSREDNDGNGYAGDVYGYNFVKDTGVITWDDFSDTGHGSHVAGVIAAQNDNGEGISSIAGGTASSPGVKLMSCQIFSGDYGSNVAQIVKAVKYAADNGAVILQCSWGYNSGSANIADWGQPGFKTEEEWAAQIPLEKVIFDYFLNNAGSPNGPIEGGLVIFAAGNEWAPQAGFPGAAEKHIAVSATAADYTPAVYTNYGPGTDIAAPGGDQDYYYEEGSGFERGQIGTVLSTLPYHVSESGYGYMEGTSMACPHVSGVAALGLSYAAKLRRHFKADEFRELILQTTTPIDEMLTGNKKYYRYNFIYGINEPMLMTLSNYRGKMGVGQVNADKLLKAIEGSGAQMSFPNIYVNLDGEVRDIPAKYFLNGESLAYEVTVANTGIASASVSAGVITVKGIAVGTTSGTVKASNGETHTFNITVRKSAGGSGWL